MSSMVAAWKKAARRANPRTWPMMGWAVLALVLVAASTTVVLGMSMYAETEHRQPADTH